MIFTNPRGAPELACDHCGCRWVDRFQGKAVCYECGSDVPPAAIEEFQRALESFAASHTTAATRSPS